MHTLRLLILSILLSPSQMAADRAESGTLYWGNGDSLNGTLVSAKGNTLTWKSPLFAHPLSLDLSVLSAVRFAEPADQEAREFSDDFRITLTNNNVLFGTLADVDGDTFVFESQRHERFSIPGHLIRHLQRHHDQGLTYLGPRSLDEWKIKVPSGRTSDWRQEDDGSLTTVTGESMLSMDIRLPPRCEMEVVLFSTELPDFAFRLGGSIKTVAARVEMWGDSLVIAIGNEFVDLLDIDEKTRQLHFHVFVDFETGVIAVYSESGRKLGELRSKEITKATGRMSVEAVDSSLTLKHLQVAEWNGELPKNLDRGINRIHLSDGNTRYGSVTGYSPETGMLQLSLQQEASDEADDSEKKGIEVPLSSVTKLVLSMEESKTTAQGKTVIAWQNGGFLSGELVSLSEQHATLKTSYSKAPIRSSLDDVRRIRLPNTHKPKDEPDRLFFDGGSLRGNLTVEDNEEPIRWTPVGGKNATTLVSGGNARFQRGAEPEQVTIDAEQFPDVVYLKDGDVAPCRIERCDDKKLVVTSPVFETRQLNLNLVRAVEFGNSSRKRQKGFSGKGWRKLSGSPGVYSELLSLDTSCAFGHPSVLTGDAISMTMNWKPTTYGTVTFFLFAENLRSPKFATPVSFNLQPGMISVSDRVPADNNNNPFGFGFGFGFNQEAPDDLVRTKNHSADIELLVQDGQVQVSINGRKLKSFDLNSSGSASRGLLIKSSLMNVNNGRAAGSKPGNNVRKLVDVRDFLVSNLSGASAKQFILEESRNRTLIVPRFRKDDPPTHVVIAPNGDLLRGRLNEIRADEVVFESRLETFRFPRNRISSVIWLSTEDEETDSSDARPKTAVQAQLDNGYTLTMTPERMADGHLVGESRELGLCRIPAKSIRDLFLGNPKGRNEILSYVQWIRRDAKQPEWEMPEAGDSDAGSEMVGQVMDDFELPTLDGGSFRLSDHADKVVVLDFWASWCGPCVAALPEYVNAMSEFNDSQAVFVAVNLEESVERIEAFLDQHRLSPTVAMDRGSLIAKRFKVNGIPHSVVLGPGAVIRHVTVGYQAGIGEKTHQRVHALLDEDAGQKP